MTDKSPNNNDNECTVNQPFHAKRNLTVVGDNDLTTNLTNYMAEFNKVDMVHTLVVNQFVNK